MEWIQRNPKKAVGLSALAVLVVIILVWGMSGGSGTPTAEPTVAGPSLATPTATPSHKLTALSSPSAPPTAADALMQALTAQGGGSFPAGSFGTGSSTSLTRHRVVIAAESDGEMMAVGWWIPFADGARTGSDTSHARTFRHADGTWGDKDIARILAYGGPFSSKTVCTVTVDGRVTERQEARGPYGRVFCQG